jgi:hypothetical protein
LPEHGHRHTRLECHVVCRAPPWIISSAPIDLPIPEHLEYVGRITKAKAHSQLAISDCIPAVGYAFKKDHVLRLNLRIGESRYIDSGAVAPFGEGPYASLIALQQGGSRCILTKRAKAAGWQVYPAVFVDEGPAKDGVMTPTEIDLLAPLVCKPFVYSQNPFVATETHGFD